MTVKFKKKREAIRLPAVGESQLADAGTIMWVGFNPRIASRTLVTIPTGPVEILRKDPDGTIVTVGFVFSSPDGVELIRRDYNMFLIDNGAGVSVSYCARPFDLKKGKQNHG